jgi:DNA polymerase-3 subunit beta
MRVSCMQENLDRGLSLVSRAVGPRTTLPVLSNVLLQTDNGRLRLSGTNLEMGISCWIGARVEEDGAVTIPARTLTDLVNMLPPEPVEMYLTVRTQTLHLACGSRTADIKGIDAHEFPLVPEPGEEDDRLPIPVDLLRSMIGKVAFAAAHEDSRPSLTGVLMEFDENHTLTLAAADGFRLSVCSAPIDTDYFPPFSVVVPARTLSELARVSAGESQQVYFVLPRERAQVLFYMTDTNVFSQVIEGSFPDYRQIIPREAVTRTTFDTAQLLRACRWADVFAREAANHVRFDIRPQNEMAGQVTVRATSAETGDSESVLTTSIEGEPIEIAFNARYLIEVLSVVDQDRVVLETTDSSRPGVLRPEGDPDFTHVVMPMHIGR